MAHRAARLIVLALVCASCLAASPKPATPAGKPAPAPSPTGRAAAPPEAPGCAGTQRYPASQWGTITGCYGPAAKRAGKIARCDSPQEERAVAVDFDGHAFYVDGGAVITVEKDLIEVKGSKSLELQAMGPRCSTVYLQAAGTEPRVVFKKGRFESWGGRVTYLDKGKTQQSVNKHVVLT